MSEKFTILTVCTGNICRSPLGEQLLALGLANVPEVHVESAGTQALVGKGMTEQSQAIASSLGVAHPETHASRQVTEDILDQANLIFAMSREHRRAIVELNPRVSPSASSLDWPREPQLPILQQSLLQVHSVEALTSQPLAA
ncbi:hypothetical protein [Timonella senegalensis]|uniref:arsenate reductase/protein-tyrosine-phosphatase family protein n=1 Tax=Timonella senegalensis TaxID=1465825 RepID=UPI002FDEE998